MMSDRPQTQAQTPAAQRRHRTVALAVVGVVVAMAGLSYASVPLYQMFCRVTGYGGTTQVATQAPLTHGARTLGVRFDANVGAGLPWTFKPEVPVVKVRTGETSTVFFKVTNTSNRIWSATATYNVSPDQSGLYFNKISCFCFSEQTLGPGETAEWPVVFYLDPALEKDETMAQVDGVTLSYTFFASKTQPAQLRADTGAGKPKL
jgi:cytochrome c oxidase assembly protein subunit 11